MPNATIPFWRTELHELDSHRSTADVPAKQDIAIIGAGFAGASAAYYLLKGDNADDPSLRSSITILEAREACSGATGRNGTYMHPFCSLSTQSLTKPLHLSHAQKNTGGRLRPDPRLALSQRIATLGLETANEIAAFEYANAEAVVDLVKEERIACDLERVSSGDVYVDADQAAAAKTQHDEMLRLGCPTVTEKITYHGTPEEAERVSGVKGAKSAFTFSSTVMW